MSKYIKKIKEYVGKKENPGTHYHAIPWVLRSLTFRIPSPHLTESVLDIMFIVFSYTLGRNRYGIIIGIIGPLLQPNTTEKLWLYSLPYCILLSKPFGFLSISIPMPFLLLHSFKDRECGMILRASSNCCRNLSLEQA
jgi:hypothetical protein